MRSLFPTVSDLRGGAKGKVDGGAVYNACLLSGSSVDFVIRIRQVAVVKREMAETQKHRSAAAVNREQKNRFGTPKRAAFNTGERPLTVEDAARRIVERLGRGIAVVAD